MNVNNDRAPLPRVSIMIPTYAQQDVILDAVDSALAQEYPHLEVIVADDASPDRTADVVATRTDPRLRYHRNPTNLGRVGNYRNTLYNLAQGEWVVNLDGDDYFTDPGFISAAVERGVSDQDIVIVAARCRHGSGNIQQSKSPGEVTVSGLQVLRHMPDTAYHFFHLATLYKRAPAVGIDFYRQNVLSADWESLYRLAVLGKVSFLNRDVGVWRTSAASACGTADSTQWVQNLMVWESIFTAAVAAGMNREEATKLQHAVQLDFAYRGYSKCHELHQTNLLYDYLVAVKDVIGWSGIAALLTDWRVSGKFALSLLHSLRAGSRAKQ